MQKFIVLSLAACFALAGCGGSPGKLTPEEMAEFESTLESAGRAQKVGQTSAQAGGRNRVGEVAGKTDKSQSDVESKMYAKLQSGECTPKFSEPQQFDGDAFDPAKFEMKIEWALEGQSCPLNIKYSMLTTATGMSLDMSFKVTDEELKKLNDVYAMTLKGDLKFSEKSASGGFAGVISSNKLGEIPVSMVIDANENQATFSYLVDMPKKPVEIKGVVKKGQTKPELTINGEPLTDEKLKELKEKGGPAFQALAVDGNKQQGEVKDEDDHAGHHHGPGHHHGHGHDDGNENNNNQPIPFPSH